MKSILEFLVKKHIDTKCRSKKLTGEEITINDIESLSEGTYFKEIIDYRKDNPMCLYGIFKSAYISNKDRYELKYYCGVNGNGDARENGLFGCDFGMAKLYIMNEEDYKYFIDVLSMQNIRIPKQFGL